MRYRTAAILSVVLIGGMFVLPAAVKDILLPSLEQGVIIPLYERILLGLSVFCLSFRYSPRTSDCSGAVRGCTIHERARR